MSSNIDQPVALDLFVELAYLTTDVGIANLNALDLRVAELEHESEAEELKGKLVDRLRRAATSATDLATALEQDRVGIAFQEEPVPKEPEPEVEANPS